MTKDTSKEALRKKSRRLSLMGSESTKEEMKFSWKKMRLFFEMIGTTVKKYPWLFGVMCFVTFADGAVSSFLPWVAALMTQTALTGQEKIFLGMTMHWYSWAYVCVFVFLLLFVLEYTTNFTIGLFSIRLEINQRQDILVSLVNQDVDFFFDHVSGNILTRFVADTQSLGLGIQQFFTNILYIVGALISAIIILIIARQWFTLVFGLSYIIVVLVISFYLFVLFRRALIRTYDFKREVDADLTDRISNITLIKSNGSEMYEINRLAALNERYNRIGDRMVLWSSILNFWLLMTINFAGTILTVALVIIGIKNNNMLSVASDLTLGLPLLSTMTLPIILLVPTLRAAARAANASSRISQLTKPQPKILPNHKGPIIDSINEIEFKNIKFAYPKKPKQIILPNTSLKFEKGKSYAFVGETGSGKSTIGRLLLRYYEPIDGEIIINNQHSLSKLHLKSYLDHVGYVEQDPQIFYGNVYDNIRYGNFNATNEEVIEAAKKAKLHDFVMTLPEGYETILGQRGFLLSGGQKQRLVIARLFLKNPDLIILDEATSALDNIVEKEIQAQLDELMMGRTSITIAHRLSTIERVDEIIVLGSGRGVVQRGTFRELVERPGIFQELYQAGKMS